MRKAISQQLSFGDGFIDPSLYRLDEELMKVDELLSQGQLLKPFEELFDPSMGRPGTPAGVYLRMMYLKFRWGLSYEEVETEVKERLSWRYFCHLSLTDTVPDATTLIKLNLRFGEERIGGLNKELVGHLVKQRAIKPRRIRIDSTTLEAHIAYPTDIRILHQAVRTLTRTATSLGQKIVSHVRATKKALARWGASSKAKPKERKAQGKKILKKVTQLATDTQTQSRQALKQLSATAPSQIKQKFSQTIELTEKLVEQTQDKLAGKRIAERMVSFFDPEARAIVKGKLDKPVEFGRTLQLVQDDSGVIVHYEIHRGNPSDKTELISLVRQTKKVLNHAPRELATDRGYYSAENLSKLHRLGVRRVSIPKIGRLSRAERRHQHCRWFRELPRFRCGIEAGISLLKRRFSLGRVLAKGSPATAVWTGFAIFAFNLWQQT
ncbi:MAG TPA: ISNCY family transposase [Terriglobales bacterium]|jgi:IS5 family transposase|nr:ISNCY family transposase [Terriglobales bacterium]